MNKDIKYLIEEIINFNPVDYEDEEDELINNNDIDKISYKYFPKTFQELKNLVINRFIENPEEPYLSDICTTYITGMQYLFDRLYMYVQNGRELKKLDLSAWDVSNVKSMRQMFRGCESLEELNIYGWDTSNVTDMSCMFYDCKSLFKLNLSDFDTSKVTDMSQMFESCKLLKEINVSNFDTSNVKNINGMFRFCESLKELDLSNFDTSKVT